VNGESGPKDADLQIRYSDEEDDDEKTMCSTCDIAFSFIQYLEHFH